MEPAAPAPAPPAEVVESESAPAGDAAAPAETSGDAPDVEGGEAAPDGADDGVAAAADGKVPKLKNKGSSYLSFDYVEPGAEYQDSGDDDDMLSVDHEAEDLSDVEEPHDSFGKLAYLTTCDDLGLVPVSQVLKYLEQEDMQLTHYGVGPRGVRALAAALRVNNTVTTLRMADNHLGPEGCKTLLESLEERNNMTEIDLSENAMGKGIAGLPPLLRLNFSVVTTLHLRGNKLGDREARVLCDALTPNKTVTYLDISVNELSDKGGAALAGLLETTATIKELNLAWNNLRSKGCTHLSHALQANGALEVLNIGWNGLGDEGMVALGEALAINAGLVELMLSSNSISGKGYIALAEGIKENESLASVDLDHNNVGTGEGSHQAIRETVDTNKGLVAMGLNNCNVDDELRTYVDAVLFQRRQSQMGGGGDAPAAPTAKE